MKIEAALAILSLALQVIGIGLWVAAYTNRTDEHPVQLWRLWLSPSNWRSIPSARKWFTTRGYRFCLAAAGCITMGSTIQLILWQLD